MANQYSAVMPWSEHDVEERRRLVVKERVRGTPYHKIFELVRERWGSSPSTAMLCADFKIEMEKHRKEHSENLDEVRDTMVKRLDSLLAASIDRAEAGSVDHIEVVLKIEARRSKLLGADAPERRETTITEVPRMSADQILDKMAEISARIQARRAQQALPEPREVINVEQSSLQQENQGPTGFESK